MQFHNIGVSFFNVTNLVPESSHIKHFYHFATRALSRISTVYTSQKTNCRVIWFVVLGGGGTERPDVFARYSFNLDVLHGETGSSLPRVTGYSQQPVTLSGSRPIVWVHEECRPIAGSFFSWNRTSLQLLERSRCRCYPFNKDLLIFSLREVNIILDSQIFQLTFSILSATSVLLTICYFSNL